MKKRKNILFIVSRLPVNLETGDQLRVYHFIKGLKERGHRIDILGFVSDQEQPIRTNIDDLCDNCIGVKKPGIGFKSPSRFSQLGFFFSSFLHGYPFRVWQWYDEKFIEQAQELIDRNKYDVVHFSEVASGLLFDKLLQTQHQAKFIVDLIDSVSLSMENSLTKNRLLWPFRLIEKYRLKKYEQQLVKKADCSVLISKQDKTYLGAKEISIIPNGVSGSVQNGQKRDIDLLFTGNMAAEANIDAVQWFVKNVMPELSNVTFYIVGANPTDEILQLSDKHVKVTGYVEDIGEYYQRGQLFVCPMRLGAGQKIKCSKP